MMVTSYSSDEHESSEGDCDSVSIVDGTFSHKKSDEHESSEGDCDSDLDYFRKRMPSCQMSMNPRKGTVT